MIVIWILIILASLLCPFLIFLDYHKRGNVHLAITYILVFFAATFILSRVVYHYGMFLAAAAPLFVLFICLVSKKPKESKKINSQ